MKHGSLGLFLLFIVPALLSAADAGFKMDADSDWVYHPPQTRTEGKHPLLLFLSCNGGVKQDLDSTRALADSLGWIFATPWRSRNHRDYPANERDILKLLRKCLADPRVDPGRVYLFGFSGAGSQGLGTVFGNPGLFAGVITTCAHAGAMKWDKMGQARHLAIYLITREEDWNLEQNTQMRDLFLQNGLKVKFVVTPGPHGPGPRSEMMAGCKWMESLRSP